MSLVPRLVFFRRENAEASLEAILHLFRDLRTETLFCYPQPFHIFGLTLGYLHARLRRRRWIPLEGRYGRSFHAHWLSLGGSERDGLLTLGAPVHFLDLLAEKKRLGLEVSASPSSIIGGARVSRELWGRIRDELRIQAPSVGYGASEACPGLTHLAPGVAPERSGDIGAWLNGVDARILPGVGVEFDGPNRCLAIAEVLANGRWQLTFPQTVLLRDELEALSSGHLAYRGRVDWKLNRGGEKWSLEALEDFLESQIARPALAIALPDERLGEDLGVVLAAAPEDLERASRALKQKFGWTIPSAHWKFVPSLPVGANGKIDRRRARALFD